MKGEKAPSERLLAAAKSLSVTHEVISSYAAL